MSLLFGKTDSSLWAKWKYVFRQVRLRPSPDHADQDNARAYSLPFWHDAYASSAMRGLHESEILLCDRYFHAGQTLLDVGCGGGREAFGFAQRELQVTGIDVCPKLIASAKAAAEKLPNGRAPTFCVGSLAALDFSPASFDAIYLSSDIYAGIPGKRNRVKALAQCRRIVRPGGLVIFPVKLSPPDSVRTRLLVEAPRAAVRWLVPELVPEPGDRWGPQGTGPNPPVLFRHSFFAEEEVVSEAKSAGLRFVERAFDFFVTQSPRSAQAERAEGVSAARVHPSIAAEPYGREMLLVHLENGTAFTLNETARRMWELVADGCSAREVAERLAGQFETSRERLEADAAELIRQLEAEAVLRS
jgi:SAM-dependent methyltransferase